MLMFKVVIRLLIKTFKPFTPMSDQDIISLYNINTESN